MKTVKNLLFILVIAISLSSCYTLVHPVGNGAQGTNVVTKKQWYALFGAIPLNKVNSKEMAGGAENYTIKTQHKFIDYIISAFTSYVTITVQTVEVKK
jgi:PBP1b-binding outer membrane lipoprotein LpoB